MKIRYKRESGVLKPLARVYSQSEHGIDKSKIDNDAVMVIKKLTNAGYVAYIVGGAVRDLLLGMVPKDFDVVTSASPSQVRRLFYNSRIIGKRFLLVHISFGRKIIEVSTFRGSEDRSDSSDNIFGTIEEDALRRDFSLNSLYYDPFEQVVIDFTNAFADIKNRKIRSLIPLRSTFREDPVRMIRAVKYSVRTGFRMTFFLKKAIKHHASLIQDVSTSRITDEVMKILNSGCSAEIFRQLFYFHIVQFILPFFSFIADKKKLYNALTKLDNDIMSLRLNSELPEPDISEGLLALISSLFYLSPNLTDSTEIKNDLFRQAKVLLSPLTPPNFDIENVCIKFMRLNGISVPDIPKKRIVALRQIKPKTKSKKRSSYYYNKRNKDNIRNPKEKN